MPALGSISSPPAIPRVHIRAAGNGERRQGPFTAAAYRAAIRGVGLDPASQVPVYVVDLDGRIIYANEAFAGLVGFAVTDLIGRLSIVLYVAEATPVFLMRRHRAFRGAAVNTTLRTMLQCREGTKIPVDLTVKSLRIESRIAGRVASLQLVDSAPPPAGSWATN